MGPKGTRSRRRPGQELELSRIPSQPARPPAGLPGPATGSWRRPTCQARPALPEHQAPAARGQRRAASPGSRSPAAGPAVHPLLLAHRLQWDVVRHVARAARLGRRAPRAAWAAARSGLRATARRRRAAPGEEAAAAGGPGPQRGGELASAGPRAEPPARPDRRTRAHHGPELRAAPVHPAPRLPRGAAGCVRAAAAAAVSPPPARAARPPRAPTRPRAPRPRPAVRARARSPPPADTTFTRTHCHAPSASNLSRAHPCTFTRDPRTHTRTLILTCLLLTSIRPSQSHTYTCTYTPCYTHAHKSPLSALDLRPHTRVPPGITVTPGPTLYLTPLSGLPYPPSFTIPYPHSPTWTPEIHNHSMHLRTCTPSFSHTLLHLPLGTHIPLSVTQTNMYTYILSCTVSWIH